MREYAMREYAMRAFATGSAVMRIIAGLGNPGREYAATWHNLGFLLVDRLFERAAGHKFRDEAQAKVSAVSLAGQRVLLAKPQTFMNASGSAVRRLLEAYGGNDPANLIVASDDVALPFGMIRVRPGGSAGGQKGLKSVIESLGTDAFARVRLGIRPEHQIGDLIDFVLSAIPKRCRTGVEEMIERAADAVEVVIAEGAVRAMQLFNERIKRAATGEES